MEGLCREDFSRVSLISGSLNRQEMRLKEILVLSRKSLCLSLKDAWTPAYREKIRQLRNGRIGALRTRGGKPRGFREVLARRVPISLCQMLMLITPEIG